MLTVQKTTAAALLLSTAMAAGALAAGPGSNDCPGHQTTAGEGGAANLAAQGAQNTGGQGTQKTEGEGTDYYAIHGLQRSEGEDQRAGSDPQAAAPCQ